MKKILVAVFENDELNRFIYQRMLSLQSDVVEAYIFDSPEEGLAKAEELVFDVAFIDLHYRGEFFGGESIAKKLKSFSTKTLLVGATTLIQNDDRDIAREKGFHHVVEKPLPLHKLENLLKEIRKPGIE